MKQAKTQPTISFCLICNAEARIINYGALSCYSCKTFFRRHSYRIKVSMEFFLNYSIFQLIEVSSMSI